MSNYYKKNLREFVLIREIRGGNKCFENEAVNLSYLLTQVDRYNC